MNRVLLRRICYVVRSILRFVRDAVLVIILALAIAVPIVAYQDCVFKKHDPPADIALVCVNHGLIKAIGNLDPTSNIMSVERVHDETSGSTAMLMLVPQIGRASVNIYPGNNALLISSLSDRMCFRCMFRIIDAAWDTTVPGYAIYDGVAHKFYPIAEGTVSIGSYTMTTSHIDKTDFDRAHYRIEVAHTEELDS